ncbi:hypothetical protein Tco_0344726 [Tanacetum coccineum]|uniref:Uncharacterized protein n=1 Tax=Tanacetum coccineum TaxID=301880 RepID=A0ABQ5I2R2_9ASTR
MGHTRWGDRVEAAAEGKLGSAVLGRGGGGGGSGLECWEMIFWGGDGEEIVKGSVEDPIDPLDHEEDYLHCPYRDICLSVAVPFGFMQCTGAVP